MNKLISRRLIICFPFFLLILQSLIYQPNLLNAEAHGLSSSPLVTISMINTDVVIPTPSISVISIQKDAWDIFDSLVTLISGIVITILGWILSQKYQRHQEKQLESRKKQELAILELQATAPFFKYLFSDKTNEVNLAIKAIARLGSPSVALDIATNISQEGAKTAIATIIDSSDSTIPYKFPYCKENHDIKADGSLNSLQGN